ncbi:MAG TPA: GNAT family N-acetyltransferase [Allosphingosinicella sp.]|nr:GNAT family N-acetyltransferase [Allosphingosinicella sp.]
MSDQRELSVRPAEAGDLDAVAWVWRESALSMDGVVPDVPPLEKLRSRVDAELRLGWDLYVAVRSERVVGMLAIKPSDALLDQIFVSPAEQGRGVGKALLDVAKAVMPMGFRLRMAASNEKARRFYEREGMAWTGNGIHPWTSIPVHFYGWNVD